MTEFENMHLSARDRVAVQAYEADCQSAGTEPTDEGRYAWVKEWRELDEEARQDAVEAQRLSYPHV